MHAEETPILRPACPALGFYGLGFWGIKPRVAGLAWLGFSGFGKLVFKL